MLSASALLCTHCNTKRYQRVSFVGCEFAFECPECGALHLFYESLHYDLNTHFIEEVWNRYSGYWLNGALYPYKNRSGQVVEGFNKVLSTITPDSSSIGIEKIKLSKKDQRGKFFIGSLLHDHYQEALRPLYHMKGYVKAQKQNTYNIAIIPKNKSFEGLLVQHERLRGVDEVWAVPFNMRARWPHIHSEEDVKVSWELNHAITKELHQLEGIGYTISKRAGAVPNGRQILKEMLEPTLPIVLKDSRGQTLYDTYVGILCKGDSSQRAGLCLKEQFEKIVELVIAHNRKPLLIATTKHEVAQITSLKVDIPHIEVLSIEQQAQLYRDHIEFVIGTNCSGCNIPCLYEVPMLTFVKERKFPDDFYCFARMASKFDKQNPPWFAHLEKPDNVTEQLVDTAYPVDIEQYADLIKQQFAQYLPQRKRLNAKEFIEEGYRDNEIGKMLGITSRAVAKRRKKLFKIFKEKYLEYINE